MTARLIVSTGRCGSTLLSDILGGHPRVAVLSELFAALQPGALAPGEVAGDAFWAELTTPVPGWTLALRHGRDPSELTYRLDAGGRYDRERGVAPLAAVCLPSLGVAAGPDALLDRLEPLVRAFPAAGRPAQYRRLFALLTEVAGADAWVERSGGSLAYVDELLAAFPEARVLHLHRDGRETALSMRGHVYFRMMLARRELAAALGDDPYLVAPAEPVDEDALGTLAGVLPWRFDPAALDALDLPAERFGLLWSTMVRTGQATLAALPAEQVASLSYERLVAEPEAALRDVLAFFGIGDADDGWLAAAAARIQPQPSRWDQLDPAARHRLDRACTLGDRALAVARAGQATA